MNLPSLRFVVLDTETTGFIPKTHRVIEFASMRAEEGKIVDSYEQLLSIDSEIPPEVQVLTRIRPATLQGQPPFHDVLQEIETHIGTDTIIVGQNVSFDIGMLKGEGIDLTERPWIDTSMLASLVFPEFESYSLGYMSTVLHLNHEPVHRALGDVRATLELFEKCWERLCTLPAEEMLAFQHILAKSTEGYRLLAAALPPPTATRRPPWLRMPVATPATHQEIPHATLPKPEKGIVELIEEPPAAGVLSSILATAAEDTGTTHWIAVKNLEATVRRMTLPDGVRVLHPPFLLMNPDAGFALREQETHTADEATVAVKLAWYMPRSQADLPLHGAETAVWNAKLACTDDSAPYLAQFEKLPSVLLLDHRQLLSFLADPEHTAHGALKDDAHIIIDDASMLEDTATKAYGWYCDIDTLRAAAQGHSMLTKFVDLLSIWTERTRNFQDVRYLTVSDLQQPDVRALLEQASALLDDTSIAPSAKRFLSHAQSILQQENVQGRITYVELRFNGGLVLNSVPERIGTFLQESLYSKHHVSLLVPPKSSDRLQEILPIGTDTATRSDLWEQHRPAFVIDYPEGIDLRQLMHDPPAGKTIVLAASKRSIDEAFVHHAEELEQQGTTLICQGLNGGIGRTRAEFLAAKEPALWLLTPWAYEGVDLPVGSVDTLCILGLPFDHPSHAVFSKRAEHYRDAFADYSLPRMLHRLFRLLRNYSSQCSANASVLMLDTRIRTKGYGKEVTRYLRELSAPQLEAEEGQMQLL